MARSSSTLPRRSSARRRTSQAGITFLAEEHESEGMVCDIRVNVSIGSLS